MGVNSLPETVTRQRRDCDLNPGRSAPESSTLTTRLPSHPVLDWATVNINTHTRIHFAAECPAGRRYRPTAGAGAQQQRRRSTAIDSKCGAGSVALIAEERG